MSNREARSPRPSITAMPRRGAWGPCLNITAVPKREARSPRLSITAIPRRWARSLRVSTVEAPCIAVITALITGSITAHVMRRVNPHRGGLLGDSFTPKTPIDSPVCYWRAVKIFVNQIGPKRILDRTWSRFSAGALKKSQILLLTCWVQVFAKISLRFHRSYATPSVIPGEDFPKSTDVHPVNRK